MDLINLKDVSNLNVNFNVKVIDIDFYNISKRKIFLGHAGDYNLYVLHLIIPKDSDWADPMQIILSYQNNTLSKAKWVANPNKIVGNSYYFLVNGDIVSTAGEGFLQFQVVLPSKDATTKTVIAKSKKIPYVVEESLTLEGSAEEVTPEQVSLIDNLITDYTNMLESYDLNDIFELERRVEVLEGLHGSENIYNPFGEYDIIELQLSNDVYNVIEPTHDLTTIKPSRVIETSASMYSGRQFLRLNDFKTRAGDKLTLTGKVTVNKAKENFKADRIMLNLITNQSSNIPQAKVVKKELTESLYDSTYIGILGKEGWFSYTTTLEEDGNYLIFGACAQSRQLVGDGSSSNPYAPIKISNLKLIRENEDEEPEGLLVDSVIENNINQATHNKLYVPTTEAVINYISDIDSEKITRSELFTDFEDSQLIDFTPCDISLSPATARLQASENKIKMFATGASQGLIQKQTLDLEEDIILSAGELYQFTLSRAGSSNNITIDLVDEEQNVYKTYTLKSNALISDKIRVGSSNITIHQFYCVPEPAYGVPSGEYTLTLTHITTIKEELLGLERFVERGEVDSQLISDPGGSHKMTGNYMLKDGFCYLTVKAQLIAGWADSSYPLPVSAIRNATTVASNGTRLYEISLGLTNNGVEATYLTISPLERKFAPNPATGVYASGVPIYFTFCYQYQ